MTKDVLDSLMLLYGLAGFGMAGVSLGIAMATGYARFGALGAVLALVGLWGIVVASVTSPTP